MAFSVSQTFSVDTSLVASAPTVGISRIDIYFKSKPQATNNKSGINNPGVSMYLVGTQVGIPQVQNISNMRWVRVEYNDVNPSSDGSVATRFKFDPPVPVPTGSDMALILQYDGDEDFVPWTDVRGEYLLGTSNPSVGTLAKFVGNYFSYISDVPLASANTSTIANSNMVSTGSGASTSTVANTSYTTNSWQAKLGTSLKFEVFVARYAVNGNINLNNYIDPSFPANSQITTPTTSVATSNGEYLFTMPQDRMEYVAYDRSTSKISNISPGERAFPVLPFYPPGSSNLVTLNCTQGSNTIVATGNVNFNTLMSIYGNQPEYIIITSQNALGANADIVNVRQVTNILSNTSIQIDQALSFSNAVAVFYRAPVATVHQFKTARFVGVDQDIVILKNSSANSSMRFTRQAVANIAVNTGGTGYSNSDYITVSGYESVTNKILGNHAAIANLITNTSGGITSVWVSNTGCGFANIANVAYAFSNSTGGASAGSTANLRFTIATNLKTEFLGFDGKGGNFVNTRPIDIEIGQVMPALIINNPSGSFYDSSIRYPYYSLDDTASSTGRVTYCDIDGNWDVLNLQTLTLHNPFEFSKRRVLPSWSNEQWVPYANGTPSKGLGGTSNGSVTTMTSNASVLTVTAASNNDFVAITAVPIATKITYSRYILNNDYTNENTNYGNSWAKGIEVKFNLANNALAEDMLVYATVYKPSGTDIQVYVRFYNTTDNDSFDTKEWTWLQCRAGANNISSPTDTKDVFEMTWGLPSYPNVAFQVTGSVTTTNGSRTLTGAGTTFSSNLVSGDMILIQNPLFSNNYQVALVNVVTSNTVLTINNPVSNLNMIGSGFTISKLGFKYQAFNNGLNSNVVRYYSSTLSEFNGFNTAAVKMVLLSANGLSVPLADDVRAVAVSA